MSVRVTPRCNAVDTDVALDLNSLASDRGHPIDGKFAGWITDTGWLTGDADHRAGVEDDAAALCTHDLNCRLDGIEQCVYVEVHNACKVLRLVVLQLGALGYTGVVDQNIQSAVLFADLGDGFAPSLRNRSGLATFLLRPNPGSLL